MNDNKRLKNGYQPVHEGYQPAPAKPTGGNQPTKNEQKPSTPQSPPKKP